MEILKLILQGNDWLIEKDFTKKEIKIGNGKSIPFITKTLEAERNSTNEKRK